MGHVDTTAGWSKLLEDFEEILGGASMADHRVNIGLFELVGIMLILCLNLLPFVIILQVLLSNYLWADFSEAVFILCVHGL